MTLRSITLEHFGPFSTSTTIELQPDVTVLTGPNDTGKSSVLSAIKMFCQRTQGQEHHVNMDRVGNYSGPWNGDQDVRIKAEFKIEETPSEDFTGALSEGDLIHWYYKVNQPGDGYQLDKLLRRGLVQSKHGIMVKRMPRIVEVGPDAVIKSSINLAKLNAAEEQLLKLGFGPQFAVSSIQSLSTHSRAIHLARAEEALNARLKEFLPSALDFKFRFTDIGGEGKSIGVSLIDLVGGYAPVELRGTGVRRLLTLMGAILQDAAPNVPTVLLLDEPETSLHADAQHQLRRVLESIGSEPQIQVVYATHSPSMVNPAYPERIRVFARHRERGIATTQVTRPSYGENFQRVRISLGLTPSDSLFYGLVTILVEGDTEARCLGDLLRRLDDEGVEGFDRISTLLESCHFVCSEGDSISYYCKLASDQNARPIVFLDGDKANVVRKLRQDRPEVPIVEMPQGTEFENIVPSARYVAALGTNLGAYGVDVTQLTIEAFEAWSIQRDLPERMMFSKRIDRWVQEMTGGSYNKHVVMELALTQTPTLEIDTTPLLQLSRSIKARFQ